MPATDWKAAIDRAPGAVRFSLALVVVVLSLRPALAGSSDACTPTKGLRWTAASQRKATPPAKPLPPVNPLRWSSTPDKPALAEARQRESKPSTNKAVSGVHSAVHEQAVDKPASAEIRLTSLSETTEDPAIDPFQDEIIVEQDGDLDDAAGDEEAGEEAADDQSGSEEIAEEPAEMEIAVEEGPYDPAQLAQRGKRRSTDLPDDLHLNLDDLDTQLPKLEAEYAQAEPGEPERCPSPRDLKPINQITHRIAAEPGLFPQECALSDYPFQPRNFKTVTYTWKASALCHKPLYFQQPKLERYGHTFGPVLTPIVSIGHFFVMVPCLPYNMGMEPPWECVYPLGWYRPGDCAPYTVGPVPLSLRGAAVQGFVTTGLWFLFQ